MTKATHFSEREHQICVVAHMVEDAKTYWVTGGGSPLAAILLAKKLYAPTAMYVTEDGVVAPEPALPFDPIMTMVSAEAGYRALQWVTMNSVGFHAQAGFMDYGIINTLQVDMYGNINSTAVGDYEGEHRRFGGDGQTGLADGARQAGQVPQLAVYPKAGQRNRDFLGGQLGA